MSQNSYQAYPSYYVKQMQTMMDDGPDGSCTFPAYDSSSASIDHNLHALLNGHGARYANPIASFYHDANGPWNSIRATGSNATLAVPVPNLDYNSYRDAPASDMSDSGYASQAAASLPIVNLEPTDYNRECGDLPLQVNSFSFTPASSSSPAYDVQSFGTQTQDETSRRGQVQNPLQCTRCGETAKCPSDFKKHELKHIKPFVCQEPGCVRKEGFTTVNDLNRHKKSVHKIRGLTKSFRCDADRCKEKNKLWPRLDNFKQHLKRVHKGENMNDLIQRSTVFGDSAAGSAHSSMDSTLAGIDAKTDTLDMLHDNDAADFGENDAANSLVPDFKSSLARDYPKSHHWAQPQFQFQPAQSPEDRKPLADAYKLRELADAATAASNTPKQPKSRGRCKAGASKAQPPKRTFTMDDPNVRFLNHVSNAIATSIAENGSTNESLDKSVLRALLELEDKRTVLTTASKTWGLGLKNCRDSKSTDRPPPGSGGTQMTDEEVKQGLSANANNMIQKARGPVVRQGVECSHCGKVLKRECDLTKHIKRHTRPYGCTFPKCRRKFGSKNDWTRHEGKQHFQVEAWRCEHRASPADADTGPCAQLFYHKAIFENHLREQHRIEAQEHINEELNVRRIGRNSQSRFWCGFCRAIVELHKRGLAAWEERFNHIEAHYKKNQNIKDWLDVEANKTNAEVAASMDKDNLEDADPTPSIGSSAESAKTNNEPSSDTGPLRAAAERADAHLFIMTGPKKNTTTSSTKNSRKRAREESGTEPLGQPPQKSMKAETLFFCCGCKQGPFAWSLYQNCIYCQHEFCEGCERRKHETSAEETVDYNLWSHVVGL